MYITHDYLYLDDKTEKLFEAENRMPLTVKFLPDGESHMGFPLQIMVTFDDGTEQIYRLTHEDKK